MIETLPSYAVILFKGTNNIKRKPNINRTEMNDGFIKQFSVAGRSLKTMGLEIGVCSQANYDAWCEFERANAAKWFMFQDPADKQFKRARIVNGETEHEAQETTYQSWVIKCNIEMWD